MKHILVSTLLLTSALALYSSSSKVKLLDQKQFREKVEQGKEVWMIEFFAPWCGHCKALAPEYEKAAKALEGIIHVGAVDMDANPSVGSPYGVKGFPTLKFFGDNKSSPVDYNGERTAQAIVDFAMDQSKKITKTRLSGGGGSSSGGGRQRQRSGSSDSDVVVLEDNTFDENVKKSKESWFVEFYAPWCGHCKKLEPEWNQVASELKGVMKVAKVDATVNTKLAQRFGVSGYPTLKFFPAGFSQDGEVVDYNGARDASSLISWAKDQGEKFKPLQLMQLTKQADFDEYCVNFNGVCVIVFLPHIYDSNKRERNDYIKILEDGASQQKSKPLSFLWAQGGDNFEFEEAFQCAGGYPSVLALSNKKNVYAKLKGVFNKENLSNFLKNLLSGRESFMPVQNTPKIKTVSAWDGKDHKIEQTLDDDL